METLLLFLGLVLTLLILGATIIGLCGAVIKVGVLEERIEKLERMVGR